MEGETNAVSMWWPHTAWGRFALLTLGATFLTAAALKGKWGEGLFAIGSWYLMLAALRWAVYRDPRYEVPAERVSPFFPATLPGCVFAVAFFGFEVVMCAFADGTPLPFVVLHYVGFVLFRAVYFKPRAI
ncbi:MAG: hypothetical protein V3T86_09350 [Planctomycetota bacterium]